MFFLFCCVRWTINKYSVQSCESRTDKEDMPVLRSGFRHHDQGYAFGGRGRRRGCLMSKEDARLPVQREKHQSRRKPNRCKNKDKDMEAVLVQSARYLTDPRAMMKL